MSAKDSPFQNRSGSRSIKGICSEEIPQWDWKDQGARQKQLFGRLSSGVNKKPGSKFVPLAPPRSPRRGAIGGTPTSQTCGSKDASLRTNKIPFHIRVY